MKLKGEVFYYTGIDADFEITDAIVTPRRISIDWSEGDADAHLDATSRDGVHFHGHYGYPEKDSDFEFELTLFKAKHEYLLFGTWCEHDSGVEGVWVFRLMTRSAKPHRAKTATKPRPTAGRTVRNDTSSLKPGSLASKRGKPDDSKPRRTPARSAQNGLPKSAPRIESSQERGRPEAQKETARASKLSPPSPPPSAQLDHLLWFTQGQVDADRSAITAQLIAAPLSALFKVAHNATTMDLRKEASKLLA